MAEKETKLMGKNLNLVLCSNIWQTWKQILKCLHPNMKWQNKRFSLKKKTAALIIKNIP
jgi:hypothetical protein